MTGSGLTVTRRLHCNETLKLSSSPCYSAPDYDSPYLPHLNLTTIQGTLSWYLCSCPSGVPVATPTEFIIVPWGAKVFAKIFFKVITLMALRGHDTGAMATVTPMCVRPRSWGRLNWKLARETIVVRTAVYIVQQCDTQIIAYFSQQRQRLL